jgi:ActR/RegA family two-component response regulator
MKNEEWFQFFTEFKEMGSELLKENDGFVRFLSLYTQCDSVLEQIRKSSFTELISGADAKRDMAFRSFRDMVKAMLTHVDVTRQKSASSLMLVLDGYGNISKKGYTDKTASIKNFIQELNDNFNADVVKLGLEDWITRLEDTNSEFQIMVMKRNDEQSEKLKLSIDDLRKQVGEVYEDMSDYIEANARISKEPGWMVLFNKLNANIIRYRNTIAQRKGIARAKREKKGGQAVKNGEQPEE